MGKTDMVSIYLSLLEHTCRMEGLDRLLTPIGTGIDELQYETKALAKNEPDEDYAAMLASDYNDQIEEFLGIAFVACQTRISSVVSSIQKISDSTKKTTGAGLFQSKTGSQLRRHLLDLGQKHSKVSLSFARVIEAFANYYKHRDEWPLLWNSRGDHDGRPYHTIFEAEREALSLFKKNKQQFWNADVIQHAGAWAQSNHNLATGAEFLGVTDLNDLRPLSEHIKSWAAVVYDETESELKPPS
jgi:hypothetical protein